MKAIPLTQGEVALVDDKDYELLNQWKWTLRRCGRTKYAYRMDYTGGQRKYTAMHRVIMNPPAGMVIDHIDGNGLDNRRANLRICTHNQNLWNRHSKKPTLSKYWGVVFVKGRWRASICVDGKRKYLGWFDCEEDAAIAYNQAVQKYRDQYASRNPIDDRPVQYVATKRSRKPTSQYVGVSWSKQHRAWRAEIRVNYKLIFLGHFADEKQAAQAWNDAAIANRGPAAYLNIL